MEAEPADLETVALVADLFAEADEDLETVARFVQGRVFPAHDPTKLDVSPALCYEALARAAGRNVSADGVEARLAEVGEIGAVAEELDPGSQRGLAAFGDGESGALTVAGVEGSLRSLAATEGAGSTDTKLDTLFGLFDRSEPLEARFLARLVLGKMRVGVGEGTVRAAVAEAFDVPAAAVERAIQVSNDCGYVARVARESGADGLAEVRLEVGRPVEAMLAQARENVAVEVHAFDCLHADGEDLLAAPLSERHDRLSELLSTGVPELTVTDDAEEIAEIEEAALSAGNEVVFREETWSWSGGREGFESPRALVVVAVTVYRYDRTRSIR